MWDKKYILLYLSEPNMRHQAAVWIDVSSVHMDLTDQCVMLEYSITVIAKHGH